MLSSHSNNIIFQYENAQANNADGMANSADPDQTGSLGVERSGSTSFNGPIQVYLIKTLSLPSIEKGCVISEIVL